MTRAAAGLKALAAADYDPIGANITSIYKWIDQSDSGMTGATNPDPELRIPPNTNTPLGRSMFYARLYFENYVYPTDPKKACRQNIIILVTDGDETCDTTAGTSIDTDDLRADAGQQLRHVQPGAAGVPRRHSAVIPKGVLVYILTDNGLTTPKGAREPDRGGGRDRGGDLRDPDRHQGGQEGARRHHRQDRAARGDLQRQGRQLQRPDRRGRVERLPAVHHRQRHPRLRQLRDRP